MRSDATLVAIEEYDLPRATTRNRQTSRRTNDAMSIVSRKAQSISARGEYSHSATIKIIC